jgi:hypothetical protein
MFPLIKNCYYNLKNLFYSFKNTLLDPFFNSQVTIIKSKKPKKKRIRTKSNKLYNQKDSTRKKKLDYYTKNKDEINFRKRQKRLLAKLNKSKDNIN